MIVALRVLFGAVFAVMVGSTVVASMSRGLFDGGAELLRNPWGVMTLMDAYFGFLTFWIWVAYRESTAVARFLWFVLIMLLGNIAMSFYMLVALFRLPAGAPVEALLLRKGRR